MHGCMQSVHYASLIPVRHAAADGNVRRWQADRLRILALALDCDELDAAAGPAGGVAGGFAL